MTVSEEIERLAGVRQLKDEPRELYLCRTARAIFPKTLAASEVLSPRAYAWTVDARDRVQSGGYPREFENEDIPVEVGQQLFDLLEEEDQVLRKKGATRHTKLRVPTKEARSADNGRI